jgi:hypothetical protein
MIRINKNRLKIQKLTPQFLISKGLRLAAYLLCFYFYGWDLAAILILYHWSFSAEMEIVQENETD